MNIPPEESDNTDQVKKKKTLSRKILRGMFLYLLIPYLSIFCLFVIFQRSLIYPGSSMKDTSAPDHPFPEGQLHPVQIKTEDQLTLNGWFVLPEGITTKNLSEALRLTAEKFNTVIYYPGNAQSRQLRTAGIRDFTQLGFSAMIVDYRGYADNPGSPSEKWMRKDAIDVWNFLHEKNQIPAKNIFIFGESLGGAVAVQTVSQLCKKKIEPAGLLISSSFSSLADVASNHYPYFPIRLGLLDHWNSREEIPNITCPVTLLHGDADQIVPIRFGKSLFESAPEKSSGGISKQFHEIPGGTHNAIPREEIKKSLKNLLLANP